MKKGLRIINASAPGSILITGEHAVIYGHNAIVAAIDQRIQVTLTERDDRKVTISSQIADDFETDLDELQAFHPYRFVLAAIEIYRDQLPKGFDLKITSEIDPTLGLGSSAAVTIATLGALAELTNSSKDIIHADALAIIRSIQGRGSGADLAASLQGGMMRYRAIPEPEMAPLPKPPELALKYSGYKTPTADVLRLVAEQMRGNEEAYNELYQDMGDESDIAIAAAQQKQWSAFGASLLRYQKLMERLGVSDDNLRQIIKDASCEKGLLAAKISGSGLGDCVVALGTVPEGFTRASLAERGLIIDV